MQALAALRNGIMTLLRWIGCALRQRMRHVFGHTSVSDLSACILTSRAGCLAPWHLRVRV